MRYEEDRIRIKLESKTAILLPTGNSSKELINSYNKTGHTWLANAVASYSITAIERSMPNIDPSWFDIRFNKKTDIELLSSALIEGFSNEGYGVHTEFVGIRNTHGVPNDPYLGYLWHLDFMQIPFLWESGAEGNKDIIVAVIDDACDINHPDLSGNIIYWDSYNNTAPIDPHDDPARTTNWKTCTHGTHVCGIISSVKDNNRGIASIGSNVSLAIWRAARPSQIESGQILETLICLDKVYKKKMDFINNVPGGLDIRVLNMSWGGASSSIAEETAINALINANILCVGSSGNTGNTTNTKEFPGSYRGVLCVGSTSEQFNMNTLGLRSSISTYGPQVQVYAPGNKIMSTVADRNVDYAYMNGTSMSCAVVSGLAGLMLSKNPTRSARDIMDIIIQTGMSIGTENIINAVEAYNRA